MTLLTRIASTATAAVDAARAAWLGNASAVAAAAAPTPAPSDASSVNDLLRALAQPPPATERDPAILGNYLTPALLAALIHQRNQGWMQPWVDLGAEFLQKNPHLVGQLAIRRESIVETRFEVRPGKGSNGRAAKKAADACTELLASWQQRTEHSWADSIGQIAMAVWWQRSCHEVMWERDGREVRIDHLEALHPRRLSFAAPYGDPDPWALRLHDPDDPQSPFSGPYGTRIASFHPDKFVVHTTSPLGLQPTCDGLYAGCVWHLLMYEWSWRDLMALVELLGRPGIIGYYSAGGAKAALPAPGVTKLDGGRFSTDAEVERLRRVVLSASGAMREVLSDTTRVEPLRFDQRATPLQREVLQHLEGLLSKAINGSTGVSDLVAGARAAHQVAYAQSFTFWRSDVRRVCSVISQLFARYVAANPGIFPANTPTPELWSPDIEASCGQTTDPTTKDPSDASDAPAA